MTGVQTCALPIYGRPIKPLLIIFLAAHAAAPFAAFAHPKFPQRPLRLLTVGAGSQNDIAARMPGPKLTDLWGRPVVVENRIGVGGAMTGARSPKGSGTGTLC